MKVFSALLTAALCASSAVAASWTFSDASVSVQSKGTGVGGARKERSVLICLISSRWLTCFQFSTWQGTLKSHWPWPKWQSQNRPYDTRGRVCQKAKSSILVTQRQHIWSRPVLSIERQRVREGQTWFGMRIGETTKTSSNDCGRHKRTFHHSFCGTMLK